MPAHTPVMTHRDRLDRLRRDLLMLRHDVAREMGENGRDYITRSLDTAGAALEVELQALEGRHETR